MISAGREAAARFAGLSDQEQRRIRNALRRIARGLARGESRFGAIDLAEARETRNEFLRLRVGPHWVTCERPREGEVWVTALVHQAELDGWIWSGEAAPLDISVAELLGGPTQLPLRE
jgi:hypothetical protein